MNANAVFEFKSAYEQIMQETLDNTSFPMDKLSNHWKAASVAALGFASLTSLGANPEDLQKVKEFTGDNTIVHVPGVELSLRTFGMLSNNLQARTPNELGIGFEEYCDLMAETDKYVTEWNEIVTGLRPEVEKKVAEQLEQKKPTADQILQRRDDTLNGNGGLSSVKGEA